MASGSALKMRKRRDILDACIAEFRDHGFAGARVDRIASRAAVSKRTLYKHFAGKEEMFDAILAEAEMPLGAGDAIVFDPTVPLSQLLGDLLQRYMQTVSSDAYVTVSRLLVAEFIAEPARSRKARAREADVQGPVERLIGQAITHALLRPVDPAYAAEQLTGMLKAFLFWPRFLAGSPMADPIEIRRIVDDCVAMFLSYYRKDS